MIQTPKKPEKRKIYSVALPAEDWLKMMGRTKHLCKETYAEIRNTIQQEVDRRWNHLKAMSEHPEL